MNNLFEGIEYCNEHKNLFVQDCGYCLIERRKLPIVDLDEKKEDSSSWASDYQEGTNDIHVDGSVCEIGKECKQGHCPF